MFNLVKTDLKRVVKDKMFIVLCILCVVFAVITPLMYKGLMSVDSSMEEMMGSMVSPIAQFFGAFALSGNFGPIAPVLLVLILCKDFSHGTIRNKIISGHSRESIFGAMFCVNAIVLTGFIVVHALLTLGLSVVLFPNAEISVDFGYFMLSLLFELLTYLFMAAMLTWMWGALKNTGMVIVLYVAAIFGLTLVGSLTTVAVEILPLAGGNPNLVKFLEIFQNCNLFYSTTFIGTGDTYTTREILCYLLTPVVCGGGLMTLGFLKFGKRDLK